MRINNNIMAMNTHRQLSTANTNSASSMEKLSSGYAINRAGDNAAGLSISEKMRGQIRGLDQASSNAQDDISLIQTAEGALNETHSIIQRMRELAVQSANDTNVDADREAIQAEVDQLATEITRISNDTEFNTRNLLNGGLTDATGADGEITFHIGANTDQNMTIGIEAMDAFSLNLAGAPGTVESDTDTTATFTAPTDGTYDGSTPVTITITGSSTDTSGVPTLNISGATAGTLATIASGDSSITLTGAELSGMEITLSTGDFSNLASGESITITLDSAFATAAYDENGAVSGGAVATTGIDVSTQETANDAIFTINEALEAVSTQRSSLGAVQNRLEYTIANLDTSAENLTASESRIRDVDMAEEMMEYTSSNILSQAAQSMLAQANQAPQGVLQLLG